MSGDTVLWIVSGWGLVALVVGFAAGRASAIADERDRRERRSGRL